MYTDNQIQLCRLAAFQIATDKELIITPPVVKKHGDLYYIIEGNARLVYATKNGHTKIIKEAAKISFWESLMLSFFNREHFSEDILHQMLNHHTIRDKFPHWKG